MWSINRNIRYATNQTTLAAILSIQWLRSTAPTSSMGDMLTVA